ncbi:aminotransferase class I/II-fold pyridoxal phosphate-dependent enzyme [Phragmitibacter flavus]|uniref:Aminotransferase class I/II-fold pyridoxal phosphate-dependent enzyme n=1 Tax=Phragmitibacter flavus TaxID=2576071 RepID=A0A5R8KDH4_9BACT|nr:aminotransferase class I/II-fold pyridoxal phosphate-dependent enzyme [Phragmitibacter flavus]TLD70356.1 aminotransferase class I/II-fold pyridoxal phosphate-dependent enzyme [Phragmitibacter flavus]
MSADFSILDPETLAAQALGFVDVGTGGIVPPVFPSTTYVRDEAYELVSGRLYSRADNPNYDLVEEVVARLEAGADAAVFASGNAAGAAIFQALRPGDRVLIPAVMYWALRGWIMNWAVPWGLKVEEVDMTDLEAVRIALANEKTALVWIETPANPSLEVTDIAAVVELAREVGARVAVDSTFATPVHTQPLVLGADLVMHSATKYLNGHSDVVAGIVVTREKDAFWDGLKKGRFQAGHVLGPFEAWLLLRGLRTLFVRVRAQSAAAMRIAERFEGDLRVEKVLYPGLPGFLGHEVARKQMKEGFGGMMSICVNGDALKVAGRLQLFKRATSLGGVESLVEHRATVEGAESSVAKNLLRLSVGIESVEDLIADLDQALGR